MARLACPVGLIVCILAVGPAGAGPEHVHAAEASSPVPSGSFENAGLAVFVRAHEARRAAWSSLPPAGRAIPYSPVASAIALDGGDEAAARQIALPSVTGSSARSSWVAPVDQPYRPGALVPLDPIEVASPMARSGLLEGHRTPDLEVSVSKRATLGVFGEANTIEATDIRNSTVRTKRDLGAGVTLQYRFSE